MSIVYCGASAVLTAGSDLTMQCNKSLTMHCVLCHIMSCSFLSFPSKCVASEVVVATFFLPSPPAPLRKSLQDQVECKAGCCLAHRACLFLPHGLYLLQRLSLCLWHKVVDSRHGNNTEARKNQVRIAGADAVLHAWQH